MLQVAYGWTESHLHRFSLGGHPFDPSSQLFLCPYDVEEGEEADDGGIPASDVRLDQTLQEPGDVLHYLYDYGDSWELDLRLDEVLAAEPGAPSATLVDGRRAAPPEDSGGGTDRASISLVVDDPDRFDHEGISQALRAPYLVLHELGIHPRLVGLVDRLRYTRVGEDLARRTLALVSEPTEPDGEQLVAALAAHRWFLDRAHGHGIELTSAGYLRPADVEAASQVVPAMAGWIGKNNRENQAAPPLEFRESLRATGLLRKDKGTLLLTRAGTAARRDPVTLWRHLAARLVPTNPDTFEGVASVLLLAYAGTSADAPVPSEIVAAALSELGWQHRDGRPLQGYEFHRLSVLTTLVNVSVRAAAVGDRISVSPAAAALARAALRR